MNVDVHEEAQDAPVNLVAREDESDSTESGTKIDTELIANVDEQSSESTEPTLDELTTTLTILKESASQKRAEGKSLHDSGELASASAAFHEAASLLQQTLLLANSLSESLDDEGSENLDIETISEECATCRLHEALCLFKNGEAGRCVVVCSDVLGDGFVIADAQVDSENVDETTTDSSCDKSQEEVIASEANPHISSQVRARAHLRRSKARLSLGDLDGALEDGELVFCKHSKGGVIHDCIYFYTNVFCLSTAKKSAFMGDRNAVTFYGRLLREGLKANEAPTNSLGLGSPWGNDVQNSFLEGMMGGLGNTSPLPSTSGNDLSTSLLSSLLTNGDSSNGMGLLGDLLSPPPQPSNKFRRSKKKKSGIDSLAKSVLSNVMKRMEDKDTQKTICRYLQSTDTQQVMTFATMAGIPMKEESAARLVGIANGITPKGIQRSIRNVKRGLKVVKTMRKVLKVIDKYKTVIVFFVLCCWIRSAILEPFPVDKRRAKRLTKDVSAAILKT